MNAVVCMRPGELKSTSKAAPAPQDGQVIVKIRRVGICGTDIHAFEGTQPFFTYPRILGHELAGEIYSGDNLAGFRRGEIVTILPYWSCGNCIACRSGKPNCCVHMRVCGVHVDGGMVEYLSVPTSALIKGDGLSLDELALVEPLAIAAHAVGRAQIQNGEFVLVVGAGPIGLGIVQFCKLAGSKVIVMDIDEQRLEFCRKAIQPDYLINPLRTNAIDEIKAMTNNDMATAVFDATGSLVAINNALAFLAHGGRYVLVGLQSGDFHFNHPEFHKRESTLMSSRNALRADFEHVIACIKEKKLHPLNLVTHRLTLEGLQSGFKDLMASGELIVKAMVNVDDSPAN
jgi:2-desacetyl-2-hydroxyethyl bacteriochlorophyllide A dehydrogenase